MQKCCPKTNQQGETVNKVTRILSAIEEGDLGGTNQLLPLVYDELRLMAARQLSRERSGHTLQATALVHEAYLRLADSDARGWKSRSYFFGAAAEAMRRILVENARRKGRLKRGSDHRRVDFRGGDLATEGPREDLLVLDEALTELAKMDPRKAELVKLRYFAGLNIEQAADVLGISPATVKRQWTYAKAWLYGRVCSQD